MIETSQDTEPEVYPLFWLFLKIYLRILFWIMTEKTVESVRTDTKAIFFLC